MVAALAALPICLGLKRVGTIQSASSEYFLAVFSNDLDELVAGLHETKASGAQLWEYDDETGHIMARGIELALTARNMDVMLLDLVPDADDDMSAQRWDITINQHIILLRNGKSASFANPKEGMPVRLTATAEGNEKEEWIFGATPAPTLVPTRAPSSRVRRSHHSGPNVWGVILNVLGAVLIAAGACFGAFHYFTGKSQAQQAHRPRAAAAPPPPCVRRKKPPLSERNPFEGPDKQAVEDIEMQSFPGGDGEEDEESDTAPLVGRPESPAAEPPGQGALSSARAPPHALTHAFPVPLRAAPPPPLAFYPGRISGGGDFRRVASLCVSEGGGARRRGAAAFGGSGGCADRGRGRRYRCTVKNRPSKCRASQPGILTWNPPPLSLFLAARVTEASELARQIAADDGAAEAAMAAAAAAEDSGDEFESFRRDKGYGQLDEGEPGGSAEAGSDAAAKNGEDDDNDDESGSGEQSNKGKRGAKVAAKRDARKKDAKKKEKEKDKKKEKKRGDKDAKKKKGGHRRVSSEDSDELGSSSGSDSDDIPAGFGGISGKAAKAPVRGKGNYNRPPPSDDSDLLDSFVA